MLDLRRCISGLRKDICLRASKKATRSRRTAIDTYSQTPSATNGKTLYNDGLAINYQKAPVDEPVETCRKNRELHESIVMEKIRYYEMVQVSSVCSHSRSTICACSCRYC